MKESGDTVSPDIEEGIRIKGKTIVVGPSKEEYDEHMRTHVPYRNWCEFCVKGKATADHHRKGTAEKSKIEERGIPIVGIDYTFPRSETKEKVQDEERGMPIIVMRINEDKWTAAFVVPRKGVCE